MHSVVDDADSIARTQLEFDGGSAGCTAGVTLFNDKLGEATIDVFVATTRAGRAFNLDATFLEKLAQTSGAFARTDDLAVRVTALEGDQSSATDLNAILDRLKSLEETKATQDQKIADLEAALQSKASTTYVADKFAEVDAQLVRIEGIRRERAADAATAAAAAGSKTPGTAGSNTDPRAGIDDQPTAAPKPGGPATEDGNSPPGAGDGQEGPCPDQQDPPECAAMSPSGCGTLFAQTNVTAVCPNLCSANCNGGGDAPTSTSNVGMIAGIAASIFVLLACVGVAVVVQKKKKEAADAEQHRAIAQSLGGPTAAISNPAFDGGNEVVYLEPSSTQTKVYDDAAKAIEESLYGGDSSTYDNASLAAGDNLGYAAMDGAQQTYAGSTADADDDYDMPDGYTGENSTA